VFAPGRATDLKRVGRTRGHDTKLIQKLSSHSIRVRLPVPKYAAPSSRAVRTLFGPPSPEQDLTMQAQQLVGTPPNPAQTASKPVKPRGSNNIVSAPKHASGIQPTGLLKATAQASMAALSLPIAVSEQDVAVTKATKSHDERRKHVYSVLEAWGDAPWS
jgi:hypothetical protein